LLRILAALSAVLCSAMFVRTRDEPGRVYWLGYAVLASLILALWLILR
jgi:hypothetical protein